MSDEMTPNPGVHDCGGDVAAYVLGALAPEEAAAFRRHLEGCIVCRDEVMAFREVVDVLPLTVPQHRAPSRLRRRVRRAAHASVRSRRGPTIQPGARWRAWPRPVLAGAGALATAALAAVIVVLAVGGTGSTSSARIVRASVVGTGRAEVRLVNGHAELVLHGFAAPPAGEVYEAWLQRGSSAPEPTRTLFGVTSDGSADVGVDGSLEGVRRIMVTAEHAGGSPVPTHPPVIVAQLS